MSDIILPKTLLSQAQMKQQDILVGGANPYQTANKLQAMQRQLERQLKTSALGEHHDARSRAFAVEYNLVIASDTSGASDIVFVIEYSWLRTLD